MPEVATAPAETASPPGGSALDQINALMSEARIRVDAPDRQLEGIVQHALDADVRVDTTSRALFVDLTPTAGTPLP